MGEKKNKERLSIKFDPTIASNVQAMRILETVSQRKQAQVIAEALVLYNQIYGLTDTVNSLAASVVIPQNLNSIQPIPQAPPEPHTDTTIPAESSFADEYNAHLNSDDDFDYEEDDEEYDDEAYDDIFAGSLADMGLDNNN